MSLVERGTPASVYLWVQKDPDEEVTERDVGSVVKGVTEREDIYYGKYVDDVEGAKNYFLENTAPALVNDIWNKIIDEGHDPIYVKLELIDVRQYTADTYYYRYKIEAQMRIKHASPFPWGYIIAGIILLIVATYAATQLTEFFKTVFKGIVEATEAIGSFLMRLFPWIIMTLMILIIFRLIPILGERRRR